jgi:hypothetical protein
MKICGTCKHWDNRLPDEWGLCRRIVGPRECGADEIARAQDASDYQATVRCKSAFGCVLWEAKPVHGGQS